ncbi:unnamed protein product [Polarella glacialis]|uniref:Uncharacterized protein n=1 Tax=Polarella glacialis TaxID=89957 RepID=A0A813IXR0_POLGL|nr:unnamed protein product [Polarella glacialis]
MPHDLIPRNRLTSSQSQSFLPASTGGSMRRSFTAFAPAIDFRLETAVASKVLPPLRGRAGSGASEAKFEWLEHRPDASAHYKTGQRALLDSVNMRMRWDVGDSAEKVMQETLTEPWGLQTRGGARILLARTPKSNSEITQQRRGSVH